MVDSQKECSLLDTKFFDIRIKHELFARDQRNVQETSVTFKYSPWNAVNEDVTFEQNGPHCRKIISSAYQLGALAREISRSLLRHFRPPTANLKGDRSGSFITSGSLLRLRSCEACQAVKMYSCNAFDSSSIARSR